MDAKHTPGPWFVPSSPGSSGGIAHDGGYVAFTAIPRRVDEARVDGESWLDMRHRTQADRDALKLEEAANRRLIASAPDLLEALILLEREMVESGNAGSKDFGWKPAIEKTRAAIAKATGAS